MTTKQKTKKKGGNGKRKPTTDEFGLKWCNCSVPKLTSPLPNDRGQAYCLKCHTPWYH